jgi:hypothetical protein
MPITREHIFATGLCGQYTMVSLTQNFLPMKLGSILVRISVLKTVSIGAVLI